MYILDGRDVGEGLYSSELQKRQYYRCDRFGNCRRNAWSSWGRWVALVIILSSAFVLFFLCALISARRRRRRGLYPIWGTAWVPGGNPPIKHNKNNQSQYDPHSSTHQTSDPVPPPVYTPSASGNEYNPPPGPPPGQYEMQSPYFSDQYNPPSGPPPGQQTGTVGSTDAYYAPPNSPPPAHLQGGKVYN